MNEICPVYKGTLKPIIISYKLTTCQLLKLYKYLQTLRVLLTILCRVLVKATRNELNLQCTLLAIGVLD